MPKRSKELQVEYLFSESTTAQDKLDQVFNYIFGKIEKDVMKRRLNGKKILQTTD